jgi:hypothetical protein
MIAFHNNPSKISAAEGEAAKHPLTAGLKLIDQPDNFSCV